MFVTLPPNSLYCLATGLSYIRLRHRFVNDTGLQADDPLPVVRHWLQAVQVCYQVCVSQPAIRQHCALQFGRELFEDGHDILCHDEDGEER